MLRHNVIYMLHTLEHSDVTAMYLSLSYGDGFNFFKSSTAFVEIISDSSNLLKHLVF